MLTVTAFNTAIDASTAHAISFLFELFLGWGGWRDVTDLMLIASGVSIFILSTNLILGA